MRLTDKKRMEVISYAKSNESIRFISRKCSVSPSTVSNLLKKFDQFGSVADKLRSGRPRSTTIQDDRLICLTARRHPMFSCKDIIDSNESLKNLAISTRTVNNRLVSKKLFSYAATRKPLLTKFDKSRRLKFCKEIIKLTQEQINNIIFSDESNFQIINRDTKLRVRRLQNEKYLPQKDSNLPTSFCLRIVYKFNKKKRL